MHFAERPEVRETCKPDWKRASGKRGARKLARYTGYGPIDRTFIRVTSHRARALQPGRNEAHARTSGCVSFTGRLQSLISDECPSCRRSSPLMTGSARSTVTLVYSVRSDRFGAREVPNESDGWENNISRRNGVVHRFRSSGGAKT